MGKYDRELKEKGVRIVKERQPAATRSTTYLEYKGKRIVKPWESKIPAAVKHYFGIDLQESPKAPVKKKAARKTTGEAALFQSIWNSRPRVSFVSGKTIREPRAANFFHVLSKGAYPRYRLFDKNIILTTVEEHEDWHRLTREELLKKDPRWSKVLELEAELKQIYNFETLKKVFR